MTTAIAIIEITPSNLAIITIIPTIQDILNERSNQIELFGTATAHSVKKALRANGFATTQAEVSETLKSNVLPNIAATFNGKYLTYFEVVPSDVKILMPVFEMLAICE